MSMWTKTEELAKRHDQGGSQWLKLANDGAKAVVVFLGEPYPREVCFVDGKYLPFDDTLKAQGLKPSLRVALNVGLADSKEVKVLEQGVMFFKDLVRVREKYGLEKWAFEVQRHGAPKDPKTTYSILPEQQLTAEQQRAFKALPLIDLEGLYVESEAAGAEEPAPPPTGPIDPKLATAMAGALKALPRDATKRFLEKFGVTRLRDLTAAQAEKARQFVDALVQESAPAPEGGDIDPFA